MHGCPLLHAPAAHPRLPTCVPTKHATAAALHSVPCSLKKWKHDFAKTLSEQKGRQFEPPDAAKLYGMF